MPLESFRGSQAPCRAVCGTCGCFRKMHRGVSDPSCCAFTHRVDFEEVSGHRVLLKSGPGNRGRSACGTTHVASLEFPHETGLILRCAGMVRNPFQTKLGNRPSRGYQEGIRAQNKPSTEPWCSPRVRPGCRGTFVVTSTFPIIVLNFKTERGTSLETL